MVLGTSANLSVQDYKISAAAFQYVHETRVKLCIL